MTQQAARSSFSPKSPRFWLTASLLAAAGLREWQRRNVPDSAPDHRQEAFAARSESLQRARTDEQAQLARQAEALREELAYLVKERLPAALAMGEIPPSRHGEQGLDAELSSSLDQLLTEVSQTVADREESRRLALIELASRVQTSAHRIQVAVTGLAERHPGDPDLLETTMRVDHAATQQARHAQSLKVLSGEWPGQQWQKPLAMVDVVRAASGRIVAFNRVEVTGDLDIAVSPAVVEPLIHLLAELLANATEYSPPKTSVPVTVRSVQRGAVVEVEDGGLGMDDYRLTEAREIVSGRRLLGVGDVGEIPQTGFAVVGRFADRHGFDVDLGRSPYGGIRAVVLVPASLLEMLPPAGSEPVANSQPIAVDPADPINLFEPAATPAATPATTPAATAAPSVAEADRPTTPIPHPAATAAPTAPAPERPARELPQRRSRRDEYSPATEEPSATVPPVTPEAAGDWMEQFFEGGQSEPAADAAPLEPGPSETNSIETGGTGGVSVEAPAESPEGRR